MFVLRKGAPKNANVDVVALDLLERTSFHPMDVIEVDTREGFVRALRPGGENEEMYFEATDQGLNIVGGVSKTKYQGHHLKFLPTLLYSQKLRLEKVADSNLPVHLERWVFAP